MDVGLLASVVITTRNRKNIVLDCLNSVLGMNYTNFEVILVDNASSDGTVQAVRKKFPRVKVVTAKENLGLSGGKNLGQRYAKGEYILFLDSDTIVNEKMLGELITLAENNPKIGITVPKMYYFDRPDVIWYAGAKVSLLTSRTENIGLNEKDRGQYDKVKKVSHGPTCFLVTRSALEAVRQHDEIYFMTYGDTDFALRAKEAGFKVLFCPKAKLWHRLGMEENIKTVRALGYNLPMRAYYFARNRVIFMKSHALRLNFIIFIFFFFPLFTLYFAYEIIRFGEGWQFLKPHLWGSFDGLRYAFGGKIKNVYR